MQKPSKQAGFVLVVAMIMLIAITGVAVALFVDPSAPIHRFWSLFLTVFLLMLPHTILVGCSRS